MSGKKSSSKTPLRKPKTGKGFLQVGNPGNKGGGRHPDEFKAMCRELASSEAVRENVLKILDNPILYQNLYVGALKWATEHGYGKPKESIDIEHSGEVTVKQEWSFGARKVGF